LNANILPGSREAAVELRASHAPRVTGVALLEGAHGAIPVK
jgi:hypothetical protein